MAAYQPRLMPSATDATDLPEDFFQRECRFEAFAYLGGSHGQSSDAYRRDEARILAANPSRSCRRDNPLGQRSTG